MTPRLMTVRNTALEIQAGPRTVRRLIHAGLLDACRVGGEWRVPREALEQFIARGGEQRHDDERR